MAPVSFKDPWRPGRGPREPGSIVTDQAGDSVDLNARVITAWQSAKRWRVFPPSRRNQRAVPSGDRPRCDRPGRVDGVSRTPRRETTCRATAGELGSRTGWCLLGSASTWSNSARYDTLGLGPWCWRKMPGPDAGMMTPTSRWVLFYSLRAGCAGPTISEGPQGRPSIFFTGPFLK